MAEAPNTVSEWFSRYGATVFRRCRQLLGNDDRARDAVQEVFLRVLRTEQNFREEASPMTWLYRIATTFCLQELRNRSRRGKKLELVKAEMETSRASGVLERVAVRQLLEGLDEVDQLIALARHVEGATLEEVAELSGLSRKTVQSRLEKVEERSR